jgi:hypothetical protein
MGGKFPSSRTLYHIRDGFVKSPHPLNPQNSHFYGGEGGKGGEGAKHLLRLSAIARGAKAKA